MISLIAAIAHHRVLGNNQQIPWYLPRDFQYFKATTLGKPIIMGRKTYESIGKPLPGRSNIILSSQTGFTAPGCLVVHTVNDALIAADSAPEIFIIGGAAIYQLFLPLADRMYLTEIDYECKGDTFFPAWSAAEWQEISRQPQQPDTKNPWPFAFVVYERKTHLQ